MKIFRKGRQTEEQIRDWLLQLRDKAYVPESGFAVGVVLRARLGAEDDYYFAGVNVENVDHRLSTHGEEGAISALVTGLGKEAELVEAWLMSAPQAVTPGAGHPAGDILPSCCGKCRQQIAGLASAGARIHYRTLNGGRQLVTTVGEFLPDVFTFRHFIPDFVPNRDAAALSAAAVGKRLSRKGPLAEAEISAWLKELVPVDYATKVSQSAVLELENGFYVAGARVEEAAYIDISPVQSALGIAAAEFGAQRVKAAWVHTHGRDDKKLPPDVFGALPLSSLQALVEFADDMPISYAAGNGFRRTTLAEAVRLAPNSRRRYMKI